MQRRQMDDASPYQLAVFTQAKLSSYAMQLPVIGDIKIEWFDGTCETMIDSHKG
jgi:hypothetical protein